MTYKRTIGVDVGKCSLDVAILTAEGVLEKAQLDNNGKKIKAFFKRVGVDSETLVCMEHTGIYNQLILTFLDEVKANVWVVNAIHLKRSMGLVRGKSDIIDAERIARFAFIHQSEAVLWEPKREVIQELKNLATLRARLIKAQKILTTPLAETRKFCKKQYATLYKASKSSIRALMNDVKEVDKQIRLLIKSDEQLNRQFELITSVPSIGSVIGVSVLIGTNEFKDIIDPRKFACHCGLAPFEHTSGTSIRGKTRVSHMANKELKTLFHMASLNAVKNTGVMKEYFDRKVAEGKNKMLVLNAIRNKLVHRIFACVRDQKKYIENKMVLS